MKNIGSEGTIQNLSLPKLYITSLFPKKMCAFNNNFFATMKLYNLEIFYYNQKSGVDPIILSQCV